MGYDFLVCYCRLDCLDLLCVYSFIIFITRKVFRPECTYMVKFLYVICLYGTKTVPSKRRTDIYMVYFGGAFPVDGAITSVGQIRRGLRTAESTAVVRSQPVHNRRLRNKFIYGTIK